MLVFALLLLVFASRLNFPAWFYADRVGTAGEWFTGVVTAIVLYWAILEPQRVKQRDRERRDSGAAESAIRAIYESGIRHQESLPDDLGHRCRRLYDEIEIQREIVSDPLVARRMRSFMVFLMFTWDTDKRRQSGIADERIFDEVRRVSDACKAQLFSLWRHDRPPPWEWPDGLNVDASDPVAEWIISNLAAGHGAPDDAPSS